jgi:hypothetical protein
MDRYEVDRDRLVIVYERHDGYFSNEEVLADLAISNGFSLLYRRDFRDVTFRFPLGGRWREAHLTRRAYEEFFGVDGVTMQGYIAAERAKLSPVYNVTETDKRRFLQHFLRDRMDLPPAGPPTPPAIQR